MGMDINAIDSSGVFNPTWESTTAMGASLEDVLHKIAIHALRAGSYLTDPACKTHEFYRRLHIVDPLNPTAHPLVRAMQKISLCLAMAGWLALAVFTTVPGLILRAIGIKLQKTPFFHVQTTGENKILPPDHSFSLLFWNICCNNGGFCITDAGVMPWAFRIDEMINKIVEKDADVNCLCEVYDVNTGFYICEKLKQKGYNHFYFNIGAKALGIASGLFVASKYSIKCPEFTRFPLHMLVGRTKGAAKGIFAFDLESQGKNFARIFTTHLQHSEQPQFPTGEEIEARRKQMDIILDKVKLVKDRCAIVTGDLNLDDGEHALSFWRSHFDRIDFGTLEKKTWGGDAFCARLMKKCISGPLNLDYMLIAQGTGYSIGHSLVKTGFDSKMFKKEALSDHEGLLSRIIPRNAYP